MSRIHDGTPALDTAAVHAFFESRARSAEAAQGNAATMFTDTEEADARHAAEVALALTHLGAEKPASWLDVGCGTGAWGTTLLSAPPARLVRYAGLDFSEALLALARQRSTDARLGFHAMAAGAIDVTALGGPGGFDRALAVAVSLYLNDADVAAMVHAMAMLVRPGGLAWLREPVSLGAVRLSLIDEPSEALGAKYSAIYRTLPEWRDLVLADGNWRIAAEGPVEHPLFRRREETGHHFLVLERTP
jgi:SAM-dependent methyltransferase